MNKKEYRFFELETRSESKDEMILIGYALKFNSPATHKWNDYTEIETIDKRALDNTKMENVPLRYNHNDDKLPLASTRNNSMDLIRDEIGLKVIARLDNKYQHHREVYQAVKSGLINKMSFAFMETEGTFKNDFDSKTNTNYKTIKKIEELYDVAVVTIPFYETTTLEARNLNFKNKEIEFKKNKILLEYKIKNWRI